MLELIQIDIYTHKTELACMTCGVLQINFLAYMLTERDKFGLAWFIGHRTSIS